MNKPITSETAPTSGENLISRKDTAARLGVCGRTVLNLEKRGLLQSVRLSLRCVKYRSADIEKLINQALSGQPAKPEARESATAA